MGVVGISPQEKLLADMSWLEEEADKAKKVEKQLRSDLQEAKQGLFISDTVPDTNSARPTPDNKMAALMQQNEELEQVGDDD